MLSKQAPERSAHCMLDASFDAKAAPAWRSHRTTAHILKSPANEDAREDVFCNNVYLIGALQHQG